MLSQRIERLESSATIDVIDHVATLKADGVDVIDLASGDQTSAGSELFRTPAPVREAAKESMDRGETQLSPSAGLHELREIIAEKFRSDNDIDTTAADVIVTPGTKFALFASILSLIDQGDEVVLLNPSYVSFEHLVKLAGGRVTYADLDPETNFTVGDGNLASVVSDDTALVILNTPLNPSGSVFPESDLELIRDLAIEHDFRAISDEIYEKLVFDGTHHSLASLDGMADRTVTVNGLSKAYAMNGWRIGYLTAPAELVNAIGKVHGNVASSIPIFSQHAAIEALHSSPTIVGELQSLLHARRDVLVETLEANGVDVRKPQAGMYAFLPTAADDDLAVAEELITNEHVAVTPGSAFGVSGYVRLCYLLDPNRLETGLERITPYLQDAP